MAETQQVEAPVQLPRLLRDAAETTGRMVLLLTGDFEFLNPLSPVFGDIEVGFGVHRDAVRLIELAGELAGAAETGQDVAGVGLDAFDLRLVLVTLVHAPMTRF